MRVTTIVFAVALSIAGAASAQEWDQFVSTKDGFKIDFPGQPKIAETTWMSEYGYMLPARVYTVDKGKEHYSMTVVDYTVIERLGMERSEKCPEGAETCQGIHDWGLGYWKNDVRGAVIYAGSKFLERDVKVVSVMANFADLVSGQELQLTNNKDQSRVFASIYMHDNRLIVLEATVPRNYPPPTIFQQSLSWLDENGTRIRYNNINHNEPDVPTPRIRGR